MENTYNSMFTEKMGVHVMLSTLNNINELNNGKLKFIQSDIGQLPFNLSKRSTSVAKNPVTYAMGASGRNDVEIIADGSTSKLDAIRGFIYQERIIVAFSTIHLLLKYLGHEGIASADLSTEDDRDMHIVFDLVDSFCRRNLDQVIVPGRKYYLDYVGGYHRIIKPDLRFMISVEPDHNEDSFMIFDTSEYKTFADILCDTHRLMYDLDTNVVRRKGDSLYRVDLAKFQIEKQMMRRFGNANSFLAIHGRALETLINPDHESADLDEIRSHLTQIKEIRDKVYTQIDFILKGVYHA